MVFGGSTVYSLVLADVVEVFVRSLIIVYVKMMFDVPYSQCKL